MGRLTEQLNSHMADIYAHQPARVEGKAIMAEINSRFTELEKWRWILTGGMTAIGVMSASVIGLLPYILSHLKV